MSHNDNIYQCHHFHFLGTSELFMCFALKTILWNKEDNSTVCDSMVSFQIIFNCDFYNDIMSLLIINECTLTYGRPAVNYTPSVVLLNSTLPIVEISSCGIHSKRICLWKNELSQRIEEGLFCLYNGRKTNGIRKYTFQRWLSWIVAIGSGSLVKMYIYKRKDCINSKWHGPKLADQNCHISKNYITGHIVSKDTNISVVYCSHLSVMGTKADVFFRQGPYPWERGINYRNTICASVNVPSLIQIMAWRPI